MGRGRDSGLILLHQMTRTVRDGRYELLGPMPLFLWSRGSVGRKYRGHSKVTSTIAATPKERSATVKIARPPTEEISPLAVISTLNSI